jgi:hypothetical protein
VKRGQHLRSDHARHICKHAHRLSLHRMPPGAQRHAESLEAGLLPLGVHLAHQTTHQLASGLIDGRDRLQILAATVMGLLPEASVTLAASKVHKP